MGKKNQDMLNQKFGHELIMAWREINACGVALKENIAKIENGHTVPKMGFDNKFKKLCSEIERNGLTGKARTIAKGVGFFRK